MEYRALGKSGLKVSELCLGNSERTVASRADEDTSLKIINYALESGINFIDTSDAGNGRPEELIGKALKGNVHRL